MSPRKANPPNLPMLLTVVTWGFNFVALKILYEHMTAPAVALVRFAGMYVLMVILCKAKGESLRYTKEDARPLLWAGFISMGAYMILFLEGMKGSGPAEGAILLATAPVFTTIFAVLFKQEAFSIGSLIGAVTAFVGTAIVILGGGSATHGHLVANLLMLGSAVVWAYGAVIMRPILSNYTPTQAFTLSMPGALAVLVPYGIYGTLTMNWAGMTMESWAMLIYIIAIAGVVGFVGFYIGVRQLGAARTMMYQFFVPPTAAFFAYLLMHTALTLPQALGLLVVIGGVGLASRSRMRAAREASQPA